MKYMKNELCNKHLHTADTYCTLSLVENKLIVCKKYLTFGQSDQKIKNKKMLLHPVNFLHRKLYNKVYVLLYTAHYCIIQVLHAYKKWTLHTITMLHTAKQVWQYVRCYSEHSRSRSSSVSFSTVQAYSLF